MARRSGLRQILRTMGVLIAQIVGLTVGVAICYLAFLMAENQFLVDTFSNSIVNGVPGALIPLILDMMVFWLGLGLIWVIVKSWVAELRDGLLVARRHHLHH